MSAVAIPERMAKLPRDRRGYPIFWCAYVDENGEPDFRVLEMTRVMKALEQRRCGMCGQKLVGNTICLIGCDDDLATLRSTDPPMHEECARFALATCPFLSRESARRSGRAVPESTETDEFASMRVSERRDRAPRLGLFFTRSYDRGWRIDLKGFRYAQPYKVEWF